MMAWQRSRRATPAALAACVYLLLGVRQARAKHSRRPELMTGNESKCSMQASREDIDGTAIAIVTRVDHGLVDGGYVDEVAELAAVVKVADHLEPIAQLAVAEHEPVASPFQVAA